MKIKVSLFTGLLCLILISCNKQDDPVQDSSWSIPVNEILDGGPGKDGIPSVDNPQFASVAEIDYLADEDLIVGFRDGDVIKGYPHQILDWHEIVNDDVNEVSVAITYCPLTGTAIGWDRMIEGEKTTFGVSGLLYNTNLIPYDRKTDSNWSQIRLDCVNGSLEGELIRTHQVIETTWATWKAMFPESLVMTTETGINRAYGTYPYINGAGQDYRTDEWLLFNVNPLDERLPRKERVLGVIENGQAKTYRFASFPGNEVTVLMDTYAGKDLVLLGSTEKNFLIAYESTLPDGTELSFTAVQDGGQVLMEDNEGNKWNLFGVAIEGERSGQELIRVESFIGYWVSWGAFYPNAEIFE